MPFDPAADPWGTAMLAAAALWVISLLVVVLALVVRTSLHTGARLMLVALLGFLVSAAGGTWERIRMTDAAAAQPPAPKPTIIVAPTPAPDPDTATDEPGAESTSEGGESSGGEPEPIAAEDDGGEPEPLPEPEPVIELPTVEPLPTEPKARDAAIRAILRETAKVALESRSCASIDEVALAWATLQTIPAERRWVRRAQEVARDLEQCRRRLLYSASRRHRRTQVDARNAFAEALSFRMREDHELRVGIAISGNSHERLRIGGTGLVQARAEALMDGGLRAELNSLAFAHVVLSDGTTSQTYDFEVVPDSALGLPDMRAVGLGEPLVVPEAP